MNKILNYLTNKAMSAAFVVLGAIAANAELAKTPILQTFEGEAEPVSVGYTVTGLGDFKNEVAVVFTNHTKTATWTVPQDLENVQFLVVGGGGGGGAGTGGGGGGGGGVVIGRLVNLSNESKIVITVGKGGDGGPDTNVAAGQKGEDSSFDVDTIPYVIAYGGGNGGGWNSAGKSGGSGSGGRSGSKTGGSATQGKIYSDVANNILDGELFGHKGGTGAASFSAGGGGGAMSDANNGTTNVGGNGGVGLTSDIIGESFVYGAGGGGGTSRANTVKGSRGGYGGGLSSGSGAGKGGGGQGGGATSGVANRGGGGGGGGGNSAVGGAGGSGIVVFRYATSGGAVDFAKIEEVAAQEYPYTGENQLVLNETSAYTVSYQNDNVPNAVGEYVATITLKDGFVWADEYTENSRTVTIKIIKANDEWISEPSIFKTAWSVGEAAGELTAPTTKFNADLQVVISKKDDSAVTFNSLENLEAGDYVVTWTALETGNFNAAEGSKTVEFTVVAADAIPPYTLAIGEVTETDRNLSVSYSLSCEASTSKTAEIFAVYTIEGSGETNEVSLAEGVALNGGAFTGTISDLKPGATYSVAVYSKIGEEKSELTEFKTVAVSGAPKDLEAEAIFVTKPYKKFIVTGSVTPGVGETKVTLHYSLNSTDCDSTEEQEVDTDGAFSFEIPYENLTDTLSWYVTVANTFDTGTWQGSLDGGETDTVTIERKEAAQSYYVWTGKGGDNLWTNPLNWDCDNDSCYGYPGVKGIYDYSWVGITSSPSAPIDLGGGTYEFIDNGAFTIAEGVTVEFCNGTLVVNGDQPMNGGAENTIGTAGSVMIFNNVELDHSSTLIINKGASVVFKGTTTQKWYYKPDTGSLIVRDGILTTRYTTLNNASPASDSEVVISNGVWVVTGDADKGIASVVKFRDGDNRQAQLQLRNSSSDSTYYNIKLQGTYDIKIPATPSDTPYVLAKLLSENSTCTMKIDATDYSGDARVPLIQFKGTLDTATKTAMETMTNTADKLVVTADNEDVKTARNAKLVWDETAKTLYFQQSSRMSVVPGSDDPVIVSAATKDEAIGMVDITPPEGVDAEAYKAYFKLDAEETSEGSGKWTVKAQLDEEVVKPVIAETTADDTAKEAFVIDADGNVTLNISNKKPGLYYGVQVLKELGADPFAVVSETEAGALVVTADNIPDGNAAFFRVVVDFKPIAATEAE